MAESLATPATPKGLEISAPNLERELPDPTNKAWKRGIDVLFAGFGNTLDESVVETPVISERFERAKDSARDILAAADPKANYNYRTGEYTVSDPADPSKVVTRNIKDAIPGIISGLEEYIALEESFPRDPNSSLTEEQKKIRQLVEEARQALSEFKKFVQIEIETDETVMENGKPKTGADGKIETKRVKKTLSYEEYEQEAERRAKEESGLSDEDWGKLGNQEKAQKIWKAQKDMAGEYSLRFEKIKPEVIAGETIDVAWNTLEQVFSIDVQALKEGKKLSEIPPNSAVAQLAVLLATHARNHTSPETQARLIPSIYQTLKSINLEQLSAVNPQNTALEGLSERFSILQAEGDELMSRGSQAVLNELERQWLMSTSSFSPEEVLPITFMAAGLSDQIEISGNQYVLSSHAKETLKKAGIQLTPAKESAIIALAQKGRDENTNKASRFLQQVLGFDENLLGFENTSKISKELAEQAIRSLEAFRQQPYSQEIREQYKKVATHHLEGILENLEEKKPFGSGLREKMGLALLMAFLFSGSIQGILELDVAEQER